MLCLLMLILAGCGDGSSSTPTLDVREVNVWAVPPEGAKIPAPRGMTFSPTDELLVLDNGGRILVYDKQGRLDRKWFMPEYSVGRPEGICVMRDGRISVADTHYHRVVIFDKDGHVLSKHGRHGNGPDEFIYPVAIIQDPSGCYYVAEYGGNDRVQKYSEDGRWLLQFGGFGTADGQFQRPSGMVWVDGKVFVADAINNRVQVFKDSGEFVGVLGSTQPQPPRLHYPYNIDAGPDGDLFVVEYGAGRVTRLDRAGQTLGTFGQTGKGSGQLTTPWGLAVDSTGRVLVADTGNRRIVELRR